MNKLFLPVALLTVTAVAAMAHAGHSQTEVEHLLDHLVAWDRIAIIGAVALLAWYVQRKVKAER
jgi:hypothetical protein